MLKGIAIAATVLLAGCEAVPVDSVYNAHSYPYAYVPPPVIYAPPVYVPRPYYRPRAYYRRGFFY